MAIRNMSPLGKGLKALLPVSEEEGLSLNHEDSRSETPYFLCPIAFIEPNPYQPRKVYKEEELSNLASSIREKGIIQPLVVRKIRENQYELIAGERRLRAAQLAELEKVPVIVKEIALSDRLELALIENIQRENLNPLEEAEAYAQLIEEFSLTQDVVAKRVGKNRSTIANSIRILQLPDFVKNSLRDDEISSGHARVLLSLESQDEVKKAHREIVAKKLSVRETEALVKSIKEGAKKSTAQSARKKQASAIPASYCKSLNNSLMGYLGVKSKIIQNGSRGKIEIEYYSPDDLERLLTLIIQEQ